MTHYLIGNVATGVAYPEGNASAKLHGRPVVVIDPEDHEQVERLRAAMGACPRNGEAWCVSADCCTERLTAALRSLIAPAKPPEPQGLGAVVEDAAGIFWIRRGQVHWVSPDPHHYNEARTWGEIDYAETHSEGVTA